MVTDGEGAQLLYVSGCPSTASTASTPPSGISGRPRVHAKLEDKIIEDLKAPWVQGITFLGGGHSSTPLCCALAQRIRQNSVIPKISGRGPATHGKNSCARRNPRQT
ncbi:MAG: 4Fe-4S cluster-binding domain-containing protein [Bifidobacterium sp.]